MEARLIAVGSLPIRDLLFDMLTFCDIRVKGNPEWGDDHNEIRGKWLLIEKDSNTANWCDDAEVAKEWFKKQMFCKIISLDHHCFHLMVNGLPKPS